MSVSYVACRKITPGQQTRKSGNELQVRASAQIMLILFPTRFPYMVIVYPVYGNSDNGNE